MENMENILGKRVALERAKLGLSQIELAKKLHFSSSATISQYESGDRIPGDDIKLKMCELFNCSLDYLVGKSDIKSSFSSVFEREAEGLSDDEITSALKFYKEMKKSISKTEKAV